MKDKSKTIMGILLLLSIVFNVNTLINPEVREVPVNATDKVLISVDRTGNIGITGPNGNKPTKVVEVGSKRPIDIAKITNKPIKTLDSILIFSYNPGCYVISGVLRCYQQ